MSLIDTVCIGTCGSTLELAALGPASLLFSCTSSLFSALTATTLSEISTLLARGDSAGAAASFGEALQVAMVAGFVVMGIYGSLSVQMILLLGVAADVVPTAASYLAMRSVAAPAAKGTAICAVRSEASMQHLGTAASLFPLRHAFLLLKKHCAPLVHVDALMVSGAFQHFLTYIPASP
jgi:Na+-driven multidrug efflux pump